ncbi:hypothetical protein L5G28_02985 [Gordonia sp. HY285]|uniref:hypothetical protein n=1 Tax=Gordonia liuliyuniae TaxID=2911517 RepID=UPI001F3548C7|nr:hypothetical protein [Gordonia liuliyuniae]MCF8609129.1 hypothetical protein [Gordonia liuliyuniae]
MSSNQRRSLFSRRPQQDRATGAQLAALTDAFFACEATMGRVAPAVRAARSVSAGSIPSAEWNAVRDQYDAVISQYLTVSAEGSPEATPAAVDACLRGFGQVSATLERFSAAHSRALNAGRAAIAGAEQADRDARVTATNALAALDAAAPEHVGLSSVRAAADRLARDLSAFDAASGLADRQRCGEAVIAAAQNVQQLLAQAPGLAADADRTIRSLDTRMDAVTTRLDKIPDVVSALLREFSSECSADLMSTPDDVRADLAAAATELDRARSLLAGAPDEALAAAEKARNRLSHADEALDRAFDRLTDLREVRRDPVEASAQVRFRVRDAQHFALGHGLERDWGSVLDAQSDRIDRAGTTLERIHPDYWSYLTQLRAVDRRITEIIGRMRDQVARP